MGADPFCSVESQSQRPQIPAHAEEILITKHCINDRFQYASDLAIDQALLDCFEEREGVKLKRLEFLFRFLLKKTEHSCHLFIPFQSFKVSFCFLDGRTSHRCRRFDLLPG